MKVTQAISLQLGSVATAGESRAYASQNPPTAKKAVIGGGCITTPAVAAHVRKNTSNTDSRVPQDQPAIKRAVIGGGCITTPAVAAHVRGKITATRQRSIWTKED
jgi:hypothetical protein